MLFYQKTLQLAIFKQLGNFLQDFGACLPSTPENLACPAFGGASYLPRQTIFFPKLRVVVDVRIIFERLHNATIYIPPLGAKNDPYLISLFIPVFEI